MSPDSLAKFQKGDNHAWARWFSLRNGLANFTNGNQVRGSCLPDFPLPG